ncbi:MAG: O-antigen ligase family protein [Bacteroidota bacterium]
MNIVDYLKKHYQFLFMLIFWSISGIWGGPAYLAVIPLSVILLKRKGMYIEMVCGLFYLMVLSDSWSLAMTWSSNVKNIYMLMMTLFVLFNPKEFHYKNTLFLPFVPYLLLAIILIPLSPDAMATFQKTISYGLLLIVMPAYYNKLLAEQPEEFLKGLIYTCTCLLLYGFLLIFVSHDTAYLVGRYRGIMGNPNGIGIFCTVFFAFFTITISKYKTLFTKYEVALIYGAILLSVFLCGSRNTVLSILIFFAFSRLFKVSYWLGFTIIIVIGVVYQVILTNLTDILTTFGVAEYMRADHIEEGSGRIIAWKFAWDKIQDNFLFGRGIGYEGWLYFQYAGYLYTLGHIGNSHNSWLATWLNTGIVGLILFLFALIYSFVKASAKSPFALPLMYAVIFSATFEAWLVGSLNPHTPLVLLMWTLMMFDVKEEGLEKKQTFDKYKIPELTT